MKHEKHLNKTTIYYYKFDISKLEKAKEIAELIRQNQTEKAAKLIIQEFNSFIMFMRALIEAERLKQLNP